MCAKESDDPRTLYAKSQGVLAWVFDVSVNTVYQWTKGGGPEKGRYGYSVREWVKWVATRKYGAVASDDAESVAEAKRRYEVARAHREVRKDDLEAGRVIDAKDAEQRRVDLCKCFVGICDQAPSELAPKVVGKKLVEIKRIMAAHFATQREELTADGG